MVVVNINFVNLRQYRIKKKIALKRLDSNVAPLKVVYTQVIKQ